MSAMYRVVYCTDHPGRWGSGAGAGAAAISSLAAARRRHAAAGDPVAPPPGRQEDGRGGRGSDGLGAREFILNDVGSTLGRIG